MINMNQKQRVINYYEATHIDYRALWTGSDNRAVHFGYYDAQARNHGSALLRMNEVLAESVHITSTDTVLDAGCGYGGSAMWLAQKYGCRVTGITVSPLQAQKGQRYVRERGLEKIVKVLEDDYSNLNFKEDYFDVYWALESLVHAEDRDRVLEEAYRVLKPGGRIVIAEYTLRDDPMLTKAEQEYLTPWLRGWAMPKLLTGKVFVEALERGGFQEIRVQDATEHVRPSLRRLEILSVLNYPIALFIAPLFFRKERLENYYGFRRQINAFKKNMWHYSIITARKP